MIKIASYEWPLLLFIFLCLLFGWRKFVHIMLFLKLFNYLTYFIINYWLQQKAAVIESTGPIFIGNTGSFASRYL